jgi:hypothetical protein
MFWQSPRVRKQARPNVRTPTARASGIAELEIVVDSHEQYTYHFTGQQVRTLTRALPCGDYGVTVDGRLVASVERKSLTEFVLPLTRLQLARPQIRTALKDRRVAAPVLRLDSLPEASLAELFSHLVFSTEPLLSTSNPVGVNFVRRSSVQLCLPWGRRRLDQL